MTVSAKRRRVRRLSKSLQRYRAMLALLMKLLSAPDGAKEST